MTDYSTLKALAEAAVDQHTRWLAAGGAWPMWNTDLLKMQAAANPAAVLELIAEVEDQALQTKSAREVCVESQGAILTLIAERDKLKAENEALFALANLRDLLPDLDDALEDLEIHGRHTDQGYRQLKDWYRKVALKCKAYDAAFNKQSSDTCRSGQGPEMPERPAQQGSDCGSERS